jgi:hypothetical protein
MHVRLTQKHRACRFELPHDIGIFGWNAVLVDSASGRGSHAGRVEQILQGDWNSVERTAPLASLKLRFRLSRLPQCGIGRNRNESVEYWVEPLDSSEARFGQLHGR